MNQEKIIVQSKDLDLGINYSYVFTKEDAINIADNENEFMIEITGGRVYFLEDTIKVRTVQGGGLGVFDKKEFMHQIKNKL